MTVKFTYGGMDFFLDEGLPKNVGYILPRESARAIVEAQEHLRAKLGRDLTDEEALSCILHMSAKIVIEDNP